MWGLTTERTDPELGYPILDRLEVFPADQVNPPLGTPTLEWIKQW